MRPLPLVSLVLASCLSLACSGVGAAPTAGVSDEALSTEDAALLQKTSRDLRLNWFEKEALKNQGTANGAFSHASGDGSSSDGKTGFHEYGVDNEDDGILVVKVTASFQPYLIIKVKDCPSCTTFVAGKKVASGWEIGGAQAKNGTTEGPIVGPHDAGHFELYVTSVENLKASTDPKQIGKAVTDGSYTITTHLE